MFVVVLGVSVAVCWAIILSVRALMPRIGFPLNDTPPVRDSIIGACTTIFGLIVAFSAAGIWNDAIAARNAVQREADSVENAMVLSTGLPADMRIAVRNHLAAYIDDVVTVDWPAMADEAGFGDPAFKKSERVLVDTIRLLSAKETSLGQVAPYVPLLGQLLEIRHARAARLAAANAGMSWAQWIAIMIKSTTALTAIAICNAQTLRMQVVATHLFALVVSAAYFAILAHDRPFVGRIALTPSALASIHFD